MSERTQGAVVLTMAGLGVGLAVFVYSSDAFVLLVWVLGAAAVWQMARTPNHSPPLPPAPSAKEEQQVRIEQDPDSPGHWIINHKKTGTS